MAKKKRKKKDTASESKLEFLIQKGKEFSEDLIKKATQWELSFKSKLESTSFSFVFQHPIVCNKKKLFIIDFYFPKQKLAIELDGAGHYTPDGIKSDKRRTGCLKREGITVLRIMNREVDNLTPKHIHDLVSLYD